jgi:aminopeptidase YwaD
MPKLLFFLGVLVYSSLYGQIEEVHRITRKLCSPEFSGRGYVQGGDSLAALYIAKEFDEIGLETVQGSPFQYFSLDVNTFPGEMKLKQAGKVLTPGVHFLIDPSSPGGNLILNPKYISIEIALNREKLIAEIQEVIQKKGVYNSFVCDFVAATGDTAKKLQGLTHELASLLPVIELTNKKFTWSVGRNQLKFPLVQIQDSIYIANEPLEFKVKAIFKKGHQSQNVIGYLPAEKKCRKTLVFTAHYDHLGRMGSETYFPGANDNASGTAMLISMAKYFKENPVDCNLYFIAFAGEEAGLVGSKYFVENPLFRLKKIKFLVNLDIMGSGEEGITVVNATLFPKQFKILQNINTENDLLTVVKSRGPAANSDHYWFTDKGVPAFFIYTMGPNKNYHDVFDTYEALSFVEYEDITKLLVKFVESF